MRTFRPATPFDDARRRAAVATPTCCCCCCLVTTTTSTTMAAVYVNELARRRAQSPGSRAALCILAILGVVLGVSGLIGAGVRLGADEAVGAPVGLAALVAGAALLTVAHAGGRPATTNDLGFTAVALFSAACFFLFEFFSFGLLLYGQVLAVPAPILAGYLVRRRLRSRPQP